VFAAEVVAALVGQLAERMERAFDLAELGVDESIFGQDEQLPDGPVLDAEQLADLRKELRQRPAVQSILDRLWPHLTPERLLGDLLASDERLAAAGARAGLSTAELALLRREPGAAWTSADAALLDEVATLLGDDGPSTREAQLAAEREREAAYARGVLQITGGEVFVDPEQLARRYGDQGERGGIADRAAGDRSWVFGHVIVDEAQELSAMDWRMVVRRCPSRSMTVVGDLAQTGAPGGASSWAGMLDPLAPGRWREERLTVNYRTPSEIMAVAADVLAAFAPGLAPPSSVRDGGDPPWHDQVAEADLAARLPALVAAEAAEVADGRLAVLVPEARAAELGPRLAAGLDVPVGLGRHEGGGRAAEDALDAPVAVLTVTEAKGLEFDAVVVVDPDAILAESVNGQRDLYVALSRATRRLGVVHTGPLPAVLARLDAG
jgi:DNA helicase IV